MKTAELFALSCELGAYLSGATPDQRLELRKFGMAFGTAYQVYDDCVDLFGSEAAAAKTLGTDLAKGKLTLPVLMVWERAEEAERARLQRLVENWQPRAMKEVAELLAKYDALSASLDLMRHYLDKARQVLRPFPPSDGRTGLLGLADYLARQTSALVAVPESSL